MFSEREVHLAEVGEQSGSLHKVLLALAQDETRSYQRFLNFRKELYAPLFTLTGALAFFLTIPGMLFESLIETNMMTSGLGFQLVKASSFLTSRCERLRLRLPRLGKSPSRPVQSRFGVYLVRDVQSQGLLTLTAAFRVMNKGPGRRF